MGKLERNQRIKDAVTKVFADNPNLKEDIVDTVINIIKSLFGKKKKRMAAEILALKERLDETEKIAAWLRCLNETGLDNWEGYDIAIDRWDEEYKKTYGEL